MVLLERPDDAFGGRQRVFYTAHVMLLLWEPYRIGILAGQIHRSLSSTPVLSYLVKKIVIWRRPKGAPVGAKGGFL